MSTKTSGKALSILTLIIAGTGLAAAHGVQASDISNSALIQSTAVEFANLSLSADSDFLAVRSDDDTLVEHHHHDAASQIALGAGSTFDV